MADLTDAEMADRFHHHPPSATGIAAHAELSESFTDLAIRVQQLVPEGRERSLALTKLEEAKMWSSAGVARNPGTR